MAKGIRSPTPRHTASRAAAPMDMVHIDTAGPFQESLGGSRYVVMFVDSASRFQHPYGVRDRSTSAIILGVVTRFVANMRVPQAFRTDDGAEHTNSTFVDYCNGLRIRRKLTAPYTPQKNGSVESGFPKAIKTGHATRLEVNKLFPEELFERLKGVRDPDGSSLWMKSVLWASEASNRSATTANSDMLSFGGHPPMPVSPFCKPAYHHVSRRSKMNPQARPCFFLKFGYNHGSDCFRIMDAETERAMHSRDFTRHQSQDPLISPAPTVGSGMPLSSSGAETPGDEYVQPTPAATATPAADPATATPGLHQPSPHPRRYQSPQHQFPIALFGNWVTRRTCVCLDAREARRAQ